MILNLPVNSRRALDNSIAGAHGNCARLGAYEYVFNRRPLGVSPARDFGTSYHYYRELLERAYEEQVKNQGVDFDDEIAQKIHTLAKSAAIKSYDEPPVEHKKNYLDRARLDDTCEQAFKAWKHEKQLGYFTVIAYEIAFDLELPTDRLRCGNCYHPIPGSAAEADDCHECKEGVYERPRFTGRTDQLVEWNNKIWVRDFKTTGLNYKDQQKRYDLSHQFTGYSWASTELSGRPVEGVMVDRVYNTKRNGPDHDRYLSHRGSFHTEQWLEWILYRWRQWEQNFRDREWPMHTSACNHYAGCFFRDACFSENRQSLESWILDYTVESNWDPMNPDDEVGEAVE